MPFRFQWATVGTRIFVDVCSVHCKKEDRDEIYTYEIQNACSRAKDIENSNCHGYNYAKIKVALNVATHCCLKYSLTITKPKGI